MPAWVQYRIQGDEELSDLSNQVRLLRRLSIVVMLALAFLFHILIDRFEGLARIGLLSFAAVAQLAPALLGGLYWRRGHQSGAFVGLAVGFLVSLKISP